jgi:CDP-paratose 2-epimerase
MVETDYPVRKVIEMKVLITGGCGMIGFHAAKYYMERGHHVDVMDNLERSKLLGHEVSIRRAHFNKNLLNDWDVGVSVYDVSKRESFDCLSGHDVIIHMAGQCGVPTSIENPRRDFEVNTLGTLNVLEYARKCGATVVLASTNKVYPLHDEFKKVGDRWQFDQTPWAENGFPETAFLIGARTPYGNSKYMADLLCQEYAHTYGVRTGVFRMSCIYGPNQFGFEEQGWATWFIIATLKGWPITIYGDGDQVRDMLYVEDAIKAYDAFVQSDVSHGVWNLGGGPSNTLTLKEHLDYVEGLTGARSPVTYEDWRPLDQKCYVSDLWRMDRDLKWAPKVDTLAGLKLTTDWVSENLDVF